MDTVSGAKRQLSITTTLSGFYPWETPLSPPRPVPKPLSKKKGRPPKEES